MSNNQPPAKPTVTDNGNGTTTFSLKLSEMNLEQLEQVANSLQIQADKVREQRLYIRNLIDAKVKSKTTDDINAQIRRLEAIRDGTPLPDEPNVVNGTAPGALIEASAGTVEKKG